MLITNKQSGTNVHEVADGIYRINTPVVIEGAAHGAMLPLIVFTLALNIR